MSNSKNAAGVVLKYLAYVYAYAVMGVMLIGLVGIAWREGIGEAWSVIATPKQSIGAVLLFIPAGLMLMASDKLRGIKNYE